MHEPSHSETSEHGEAASSTISVDLLEASYRSTSFPKHWSRTKRLVELRKYAQFLELAARRPRLRATPTRDIDEFWHLHMLHPVAYHRDCLRLFGEIFDHNGGFGLGLGELPLLQRAFREFSEAWFEEYGTPYVAVNETVTKCWHDCAGRCWHACSNKASDRGNARP